MTYLNPRTPGETRRGGNSRPTPYEVLVEKETNRITVRMHLLVNKFEACLFHSVIYRLQFHHAYGDLDGNRRGMTGKSSPSRMSYAILKLDFLPLPVSL
jgi:hypothetical protein